MWHIPNPNSNRNPNPNPRLARTWRSRANFPSLCMTYSTSFARTWRSGANFPSLCMTHSTSLARRCHSMEQFRRHIRGNNGCDAYWKKCREGRTFCFRVVVLIRFSPNERRLQVPSVVRYHLRWSQKFLLLPDLSFRRKTLVPFWRSERRRGTTFCSGVVVVSSFPPNARRLQVPSLVGHHLR